MKLVMIPGLNGNDAFFTDFMAHLELETLFIPLPEDCPQDHETLAQSIATALPKEPFILLVESYAGSIAPYLNAMPDVQLQGIIFFVSLLAPPNKMLLELAKFMSPKTLFKLPLAEKQLASTYLNNDATPEQVEFVKTVIENIPEHILKERTEVLKSIGNFPPQPAVPVAYVEASNDKVLNQRAKDSIAEVYPGARKYPMEGSHFLLYTKPKKSAALVTRIITELSS